MNDLLDFGSVEMLDKLNNQQTLLITFNRTILSLSPRLRRLKSSSNRMTSFPNNNQLKWINSRILIHSETTIAPTKYNSNSKSNSNWSNSSNKNQQSQNSFPTWVGYITHLICGSSNNRCNSSNIWCSRWWWIITNHFRLVWTWVVWTLIWWCIQINSRIWDITSSLLNNSNHLQGISSHNLTSIWEV